jgi:hypothetical protein
VNLNQILNMVAPHLLQTPQQLLMERIILIPQLRGLGPDQVLVLVNGKEDILLP